MSPLASSSERFTTTLAEKLCVFQSLMDNSHVCVAHLPLQGVVCVCVFAVEQNQVN